MADAIYKDEIDDFKSSGVIGDDGDLMKDKAESQSMKDLIDGFLTNSNGKLSGEAWEAVQKSLSQFSEALGQRIGLMGELKEAIEKAIKALEDVLYPDDSIDTSKKADLEKVASDCEISIQRLNAAITALSNQTVPVFVGLDEEGNRKYEQVSGAVYYAGTINNYMGQIKSLSADLKEAKRLIDKINEFEKTLADVKKNILDPAFAKMNSFGETVKGITPAQKYQFVAPATA